MKRGPLITRFRPVNMLTLILVLAMAQIMTTLSLSKASAQQSYETSREHCRDKLAPGRRSKNGKIIGGENANIARWPGMVALRLHNPENGQSVYLCGGTLISSNWVLTAAHCVYSSFDFQDGQYTKSLSDYGSTNGFLPTGTGQLQIVAGVANLKQINPAKIRSVRRIIIHDSYVKQHRELETRFSKGPNTYCDNNRNNQCPWETGDDIALIELQKTLPPPYGRLSPTSKSDPPAAFRRLTYVAGYGLTRVNTGNDWQVYSPGKPGNSRFIAGSDLLQEAGVPTLVEKDCLGQYTNAKIGKGQVCAWDDQLRKDSCSADSGGPLVKMNKKNCPYIIGLTSWGPVNCANSTAAVYTRVSHYWQWIRSHVGDLQHVAVKDTENHSEWPDATRRKSKTLKSLKSLFAPNNSQIELQFCVKGNCLPSSDQKSLLRNEVSFYIKVKSQKPGLLFAVFVFPHGTAEPLELIKQRPRIANSLPKGTWITLPKKIKGGKFVKAKNDKAFEFKYPLQFRDDGSKLLLFTIPRSQARQFKKLMNVPKNDKAYLEKVEKIISSAHQAGSEWRNWSYGAFDLKVSY